MHSAIFVLAALQLTRLPVGATIPPPQGTPYTVNLGVDLPLTLGMGIVTLSIAVSRKYSAFTPSCDHTGENKCDKNDLLGIDRYAVGRNSHGWEKLSDMGETLAIGLPLALDAVDTFLNDADAPWTSWGTNVLVMGEAMMAAGFFAHVLKSATDRPRPWQYSEDTYRRSAETETSFPSGHATIISAGMTAYATTFWLKHSESPWRFVVTGACGAFAGAAAWGRVESGNHFSTDVIAGFAAGTAIGIMVPFLHLREDIQWSVAPTSDGGGQAAVRLAL